MLTSFTSTARWTRFPNPGQRFRHQSQRQLHAPNRQQPSGLHRRQDQRLANRFQGGVGEIERSLRRR